MAPSILSLPKELVDMIAFLLPLPQDCLSLRLTCRKLKDESFNCFKVTRFTSRTCTLTRPSLQHLLEISTSQFAGQVKDLSIKFLMSYPYNDLFRKEPKYAMACGFYSEQQTSIRQSAVDKLERIMRSLASLQSLSIIGLYDSHFDVADSCFRQALPGTDPKSHDKEDSSKAPIILAAACRAGISLRSLHIDVWEDEGEGVAHLLNIKEEYLARSSALTSNLESLALYGKLYVNVWGSELPPSINSRETLPNFVSSMTKLRILDLSLGWSDGEDGSTQLMERCFFPTLEVFRLEGVGVSNEHGLFTFISKHQQTLQALEMHNIQLESGNWLSFFRHLRHSPLRLQYLTVGDLYLGDMSDETPENLPDAIFTGLAAQFSRNYEYGQLELAPSP